MSGPLNLVEPDDLCPECGHEWDGGGRCIDSRCAASPVREAPKTKSGRELEEVFGNPKWIAAIEQEAASKAVAEVLDRLESRVENMKACAPDGDYIRWDVQHADPILHYVNRQGVRALIASERKP